MLTPRDIHQAEFKRVWKGYNPDEVDEFLQRVVVEYEALFRENEKLRQRISELESTVDEYSRTEAQIDEALAFARQTAADLKEASEREAEAVLSQARIKAQEILVGARRQAEEDAALIQRLRREAAQYRVGVERAAEEFLLRLDQLYEAMEEAEYENAPRQVAAGLDEEPESSEVDDPFDDSF